MYADDTVLLTENKSTEQLEINTYIAVNLAQEYCMKNDLVFNESKTKLMVFGNKRELVSGFPGLETTESVKYLGLTLDNNLSWNGHVDSLCLKLSSSVFAIKRTKAVSTQEAAKIAYHSLFESHLRYGVIAWGSSSIGNLQRILILQKRAVRVLAGLNSRDSCRPAFKNLRILTITSLYILEAVMYCVNNNTMQRNRDIHNHNTRSRNNFNLPHHRTATYCKKPFYAGTKMYNLLPETIKQEEAKKMKTTLQSWLQSRAFYTLEEFYNWRTSAEEQE